MRLLLPLLLLCAACQPTDPGPAVGECEVGERTCAGDREFQECVDGAWTEPERCPPEGEPPVEIETFCNDGLCTP